MTKIITLLIKILNTLNKFSWKYICILTKYISPDKVPKIDSKPDDIRYRQFKVDEPAYFGPTPFKVLEKLDYKQLIKVGNIKPIKRRNGNDITINICCPRCNAPKEYLYENSKGVQYECKVCSHLFVPSIPNEDDLSPKCPHCFTKLDLTHHRNDFNVYRCQNKKCSYYLNNLNSMNVFDKEKFKKNPMLFKLHYIYRAFNVDAPTITNDYRDFVRVPVDMSKVYHSWHVIGLCLTYHVNYGMSYRQTSAIMYDIHNVKISHQTVFNYCTSVASIVHPVLEFYPYDLSNELAGDETYIKIEGKTHYIFIIFDTHKKIITSYRCFAKRDSINAIKTVYNSLAKFNTIPDDLKLYTDGNPIYNVAHQYWNQHGYKFDLIQIVGLKNMDPISKKYRSYKQIIERLNRTLKYYYRPTNGLNSVYDADTYMILFSVCFNFLRPHSSLDYKVPVHDDSIMSASNMSGKWIKLIEMGYQYITNYS